MMSDLANTTKSIKTSENLLGIVVFNEKFEVLDISLPSNKTKLLGYKKDEFVSCILDLINPSDKLILIDFIKKIDLINTFQLFHLNFIHKKNKIKKSPIGLTKLENGGFLLSIFNFFEKAKSDKKFSVKLKYEKALSKASKILINDNSDINEALRELLLATKASRVYVFKNFIDNTGDLCMQQIYEQCEEGIEPQIDNPFLQNLSYTAINDKWYRYLSVNKIIRGYIDDLEKEEQEILRAQGVDSIIVLPINNKLGWFGYIGFDSVGKKRKWKNLDLKLLELFSEMLGSYFLNLEYKKTLENQNLQLKKLLENQNKFLSIVSHDLRTPFRQILSFSNLIEKQINLENLEKDAIKEFNSNIKNSTEKTLNLLSSLLEWSKITKGEFSYNPEKINLKKFIDFIEIEHKEAFTLKNLEFKNSVNESFNVFADKTMLHIVFNNLISNAYKFSHVNGRIEISSKNENGIAEISIQDNGKGIPKDKLNNLFKINKNVSEIGTMGETGSGLGLHLCKEFIEKNKGKIDVVSEEGNGCNIKLILPIRN